VRGDEQLRQLIAATSQDYLLCVCSTGRVCQIAVHRIPEGKRSTKGEPIRNLLGLGPDEEVVAILPVDTYDEKRYLVTFSAYGKVKKSPLSEYKTIDVDGALDMKLANGDRVVMALISHGRGEYFVTADNAQTLRFSDEQLRAQGRVGQGVTAMALGKGAAVVSASYLDGERGEALEAISLLVMTESGLGKKVLAGEYPQKGRATAGVASSNLQEKDRILLTMLVHEDETLLVTWLGENGEKGEHVTVIRETELRALPRAHKGVSIVNGRIINVVRLI
jgi:DNA gyrase subunit A